MKTSLEAGTEWRESRSKTENWRQPGGDSQVFEPRPLPDTWWAASETKGTGIADIKAGFLLNALAILAVITMYT